MYRRVLCIFLCLSILLCGCTRTNIFQPEHLFNDSSEDITVYTNDGRIIKFKSGDYQVSNEEGGIIKGKGKLVIDIASEEHRTFEGTIGFSEIKDIKTIKLTETGTMSIVGLLFIGMTLLWYALSNPFKM
jgi:hypothetical protein